MITKKIQLISLCTLLYLCSEPAFASVKHFIASSPCKSDSGFATKLDVNNGYRVVKVNNYTVDLHMTPDNISTFKLACGKLITLNPFFSDQDTTDLYIPKQPLIDEFDKSVLKICGKWNSYLNINDFKQLLINNEQFLNEMYKELDGSIYPNQNQTLEEFSESFANIWSKSNGFKHIFCGSPDNHKKKLGGLHFAARYLDMYNDGNIGFNNTCKHNKVKFPIYTVGVDFRLKNGSIATKCSSGYNYNLHAKDIFIHATKAFKYNYQNNSPCYYKINDNNNYQSYMLFVPRNNYIITFYPNIDYNLYETKECNYSTSKEKSE